VPFVDAHNASVAEAHRLWTFHQERSNRVWRKRESLISESGVAKRGALPKGLGEYPRRIILPPNTVNAVALRGVKALRRIAIILVAEIGKETQ